MSDSVLLEVVYLTAVLVAIGFALLASYIGFSLNRVLGSKTHRDRALWMGISSGVFVVYLSYLILEVTNPSFSYVLYILRPIAIVVIFAVVFTTIRISIDEDSLHRNTLYWRGLGWIALILVIVLASVDAIVWYGAGFSIELDLLPLLLMASIVFYSGAVLVVSSLRTPDPTIRRYVLWLGLTMLGLVFSFAFNPYFFIPIPVVSYFYYRAANSLTPISRIAAQEAVPVGPKHL